MCVCECECVCLYVLSMWDRYFSFVNPLMAKVKSEYEHKTLNKRVSVSVSVCVCVCVCVCVYVCVCVAAEPGLCLLTQQRCSRGGKHNFTPTRVHCNACSCCTAY